MSQGQIGGDWVRSGPDALQDVAASPVLLAYGVNQAKPDCSQSYQKGLLGERRPVDLPAFLSLP